MQLRGIGYAGAAAVMFGLGAVLAKLVGADLDATLIAALDLGGGRLILAGWLALTGTSLPRFRRTLTRDDWLNLFLLACPGTALPLLLIIAGFARTSALQGGFLLQVSGVAAVLFALFLLRERVRLKQGRGILPLLGGGTLVIVTGPQPTTWGRGGLGDGLIFVRAVGLGFGFVPAKRLAQRLQTPPLTALRLVIGAVTLLPVLAIQILIGAHGLLWQSSFALVALLFIYILIHTHQLLLGLC